MSDPVFVPIVRPAPAPEVDPSQMSIIEHLEELRRRLIISAIAYAVAAVAGMALSGFAIDLLVKPLSFLPHAQRTIYYFGPMDYFIIRFKVGAVIGVVLALPVLLHQAWRFVAPGLRPVERRFAGPLLFSALTLFALGAALSYLFLYIAIRLVSAVSHDSSLQFFPQADAYLGFVVVLMLVFGLAFEFPVALVIGALMGLVSSARLRSGRKVAYFGIVVAGNVFTPGLDPLTPFALIIPLLALYEASILVIRRMGR